MRNILKMLGLSMAGVGALVIGGGADAVDNSRVGYNISRLNRNAAASPRAFVAPTLGKINLGLGNTVVDTSQGGISGTTVTPGSTGTTETPEEVEYKVDDCMNDILRCINNGALPGGLNDLFDADAREMVFSAGGICVTQIENCMAQLGDLYYSPIDVWYDFNQRKIQPEYYNFVLRQTGLTPYQAQETCKGLDRNTYGTSFSAMGNADGNNRITNEYDKDVYTYNNQTDRDGKNLTTKNPEVDGKRGYYARWDATQGKCLVRVAAYNKDKLVKNSWLFGQIGNDNPAEVWQATGETFRCNKDLFGFALLNTTKTVALIGVGGGTVLGAGIGAATGHKKHNFDCSKADSRKALFKTIDDQDKKILKKYLKANDAGDYGIDSELSQEACVALVQLKEKYKALSAAVDKCTSGAGGDSWVIDATLLLPEGDVSDAWYAANLRPCYNNGKVLRDADACAQMLADTACAEIKDKSACETALSKYKQGSTQLLTVHNLAFVSGDKKCKFENIRNSTSKMDIYCDKDEGANERCVPADQMKEYIEELKGPMGKLKMEATESTIGKNLGIGAAVGAGAGGVATAITAFVENADISCHVGDNLAKVKKGKSYTIDSLRDFYVKWGMNLGDMQTTDDQPVSSKAEWAEVCNKWNNDLDTCLMLKVKIPLFTVSQPKKTAVVNNSALTENTVMDKIDYRTASNACRVQGGRCVMNPLVSAQFFK